MLHFLNIGALALWLSMAGLAAVVRLLPPEAPRVPAAERALVARWVEPEIAIGGEGWLAGDDAAAEPRGEPVVPAELPETPPASLPGPPELPAMAEAGPLPEVPELPKPAVGRRVPAAGAGGEVAGPAARRVEGAAGGTAGGGKLGAGGGMSRGARLAGGRMPPPVYPAEARRRNQEGTVVIAFTVDVDGSVIGARVASPSPWPLLNDAAVRAVRRWKFPAGPVMNLQQPVVFQLR